MKKNDNGSVGVGLVTLIVVAWVFCAAVFVLNRESNIAHHSTTTICSIHYSTTDGEYQIHTADSGDYHIDHQFSDQESSALYHKISAHVPGTYSVKWYSVWQNGSQAMADATLLPASAQQNLCSANK